MTCAIPVQGSPKGLAYHHNHSAEWEVLLIRGWAPTNLCNITLVEAALLAAQHARHRITCHWLDYNVRNSIGCIGRLLDNLTFTYMKLHLMLKTPPGSTQGMSCHNTSATLLQQLHALFDSLY